MLQNAQDIKSWNERLKVQAEGHFENYVKRRIDLSTARVDEPLRIAGEFLYVEDAADEDTSIAQIKLNRNTNDALDLEKGVEIYTIFTEVYITNAALQDEWIDIVFGINFVYKKKIADGGGAWPNPITTAAGVDLQLLPGAGGITQIGDAGATSQGLNNNDDLYVSGKLEVDGMTFLDGELRTYSTFRCNQIAHFNSDVDFIDDFMFYGVNTHYGAHFNFLRLTEEVTIPVGQGAAGVNSSVNLAPANATIIGVCCRVTQAPGGGATTFDLGRTTGGNLDEFVDGNGPGGAVGVALGTTTTFAKNRDAATVSPVMNRANDTFTITTDVNVAVTAMKLRIAVFCVVEYAPTS